MHVLLADDQEDIRRAFAKVLSLHGHQTTLAKTGAEVVHLMETAPTPPMRTTPTSPFDVIVMDAEMPVMDGLTAIQQIRALPAGVAVPIVLFTGFEYTELDAVRSGANEVLHKPVSPVDFVARLEVLAKRGW